MKGEEVKGKRPELEPEEMQEPKRRMMITRRPKKEIREKDAGMKRGEDDAKRGDADDASRDENEGREKEQRCRMTSSSSLREENL